jgi:hypothetical protein
MLNPINARQLSSQVVLVSARYREKLHKHFDTPQEIPKAFKTSRGFLSRNLQNWSNLRAIPTAYLFAGL